MQAKRLFFIHQIVCLFKIIRTFAPRKHIIIEMSASGFIKMVVVALCLSACTGRKSHTEVDDIPNDDLQSEADGESADSLALADEIMPEGADELFDDFIFNFATHQRLQLERINFPLLVNSGQKQERIERSQWQMDYFFMHQDYYTLILDSPDQMELVKDTALQEAIVEKIFLNESFVRQYLFSRKSGRWMLNEIRNQTLPRNHNASFLAFYQQFVSDSAFQRASLSSQMEFSGPDPDDDFNQIEGVITPDFWDAFAPEFPTRMLYNIVYGRQKASAHEKILVLRGIANGLEVWITFRHQNNRWMLTKLNT